MNDDVPMFYLHTFLHPTHKLTYLWGKKKHYCQKSSKIIDHDYCFWTSINELGGGEGGLYIHLIVCCPKKFLTTICCLN
jgi:hypothetical protein